MRMVYQDDDCSCAAAAVSCLLNGKEYARLIDELGTRRGVKGARPWTVRAALKRRFSDVEEIVTLESGSEGVALRFDVSDLSEAHWVAFRWAETSDKIQVFDPGAGRYGMDPDDFVEEFSHTIYTVGYRRRKREKVTVGASIVDWFCDLF